MKFSSNIAFTLLLTLFSAFCYTQSQEAEIYSTITNSDSVDLGITYRTDEIQIPLQGKFVIKNNTQNDYFVSDNPGTALLAIESGDFGFTQFMDNNSVNDFPFLLTPENPSDTLTIQYLFPTVLNSAENKHSTLYRVRITNRVDGGDTITSRIFKVTARSTDKFIGAYDNNINFDSVYIDSPFPIEKNWKIKNVWTEEQVIHGDEERYLTPIIAGREFQIQEFTNSIELPPGSIDIPWAINYNPKDLLPDTAVYNMYFKPFAFEGDDQTIDTISTKISGVGVKQQLDIVDIDSEYQLSINDGTPTIDIGNIMVGELLNITLVVENTGNIPLGKTDEFYQQNRNDNFEIIDSLIHSSHLQPGEIDTLVFNLEINEGGSLNSSYIMKSDLMQRGISGAQNNDALFKINLRGNVIQPKLLVSKDTLYMGSVTFSSFCPNLSEEIIELRNIGNDLLNIDLIKLTNEDDFSFSIGDSFIEPGEKIDLNVFFEPSNTGLLKSDLLIKTNASPDTISIGLAGNGVPLLEMNLTVDSARSYPGTDVFIPLLVEKEKISNSFRFSDTIFYDRTILEFIEPIYANTASEAPSNENIFEITESGGLSILMKRRDEMRFIESDTLVLLHFNTYLGNSEYTYIDFTNPRFANDNCDQIYNITTERGFYATDSVCIIDQKVYIPNNFFELLSIYPNPVEEEINVDISSLSSQKLEILITDIMGNMISNSYISTNKGINSKKLNLSKLNRGQYFLSVKSQSKIITKTFMVID